MARKTVSRPSTMEHVHSKEPKPAARRHVLLFTDGACSGNPGPGGWAYILYDPVSGKEVEESGAEPQTTNNRMELTAVIKGLQRLKRPVDVEILTDSVYVGKGLSQWLPKWKRNGWRTGRRGTGGSVKNQDLWLELDRLLSRHNVVYTRVAGHSGHPQNDRCDRLAVEAYQRYLR
jgi:ribonuclease HI